MLKFTGNIHILLAGDPGVGKSQFLRTINNIRDGAISATAFSSTAVGLTASMHKKKGSFDYEVRPGALALANRSVCLIDELDKVLYEHQHAFLEAMEQQSTTITKCGVQLCLPARCSVIAAANTTLKNDGALSLSDNIIMSNMLLSRFDLIWSFSDKHIPERDEKYAKHVINSHISNHPLNDDDDVPVDGDGKRRIVIDNQMLENYIQYVRANYPTQLNLTDDDFDRIKNAYVSMREQSRIFATDHITPRVLESIIRIAKCRGRLHRRLFTDSSDIRIATNLVVCSYIERQKDTISQQLQNQLAPFRPHDILFFNWIVANAISEHDSTSSSHDNIEIPGNYFEKYLSNEERDFFFHKHLSTLKPINNNFFARYKNNSLYVIRK